MKELEKKLINFIKTELADIVGKENIKFDIFEDRNDAKIDWYDFVYGRRTLRLYEYQGSCVIASWGDFDENLKSMPNVAYVECSDELSFKKFKEKAISYFTDTASFWLGDVHEEWKSIEDMLKEFLETYGAYLTTSKLLKAPVLDDKQKAALLSYLQLDDCVQRAKEMDMNLYLHKQKIEDK